MTPYVVIYLGRFHNCEKRSHYYKKLERCLILATATGSCGLGLYAGVVLDGSVVLLLEDLEFFSGARQFFGSLPNQLDTFQTHTFISKKHPMMAQLLLQEGSDIQHIRLDFLPEQSQPLEMHYAL